MSPWIPRAALLVGVLALGYAIVSIAVGEGGPQPRELAGGSETQRVLGGIAQDGARLGPADAELTITVFNDLQCVACAAFQLEVVDALVEEYARSDQAKLELRHFSTGERATTLVAYAASAAGEQGRQWQYADLFVRNQDLARAGVSEELLRDVAESVPELEVERWQADRDSAEVAAAVEADAQLAADLRLPAEPAVVVDGPGGQVELTETPSLDDVRAAIAAVGA